MQTFLPYSDFRKTAKSLDYRRLGKQRVEAYQILRILLGLQKSKGWLNHPAVKMWRGHEKALSQYIYDICDEWTSRGYKDTIREKTQALMREYKVSDTGNPAWLGGYKFHKSHKSNLTRKLRDYYHGQWPEVPDDMEYVWPVK